MRRRRVPFFVAFALVVMTASPVVAQSPPGSPNTPPGTSPGTPSGASPGTPSGASPGTPPGASPAATTSTSGHPAGVPFCADVPEVDLSAAPFRDAPVYIGNEQPTAELRAWAQQQPDFEDLWIDRDHLGWVVLAFSQDAERRQADLAQAFPDVGAVAVGVDWTISELEALQQRAIGMGDPVQGSGIDILKGVVDLQIGLLEAGSIAKVVSRFAGERVCIDGIDPSTMPSAGPQPQAGDGWRLLGDARVGATYRTGIAANRRPFRALWKRIGMPGRAPAVDFEREVAIWFGVVYSGSCPAIRLDDVIVDAGSALIHPLIVQTEPVTFCTADANPHAYIVALRRDRLPAPHFRIQLQADDPPPGATREITLVEADLRVPGSVPEHGEVRTVRPPQVQAHLRSGGFTETGFSAEYLLDARCGAEWLGELNRVWWRTDVLAGQTDWLPGSWQGSVDAEGTLLVSVLLRDATDPAVTDGQPRADVTANGETVTYHPTTEAPPACP